MSRTLLCVIAASITTSAQAPLEPRSAPHLSQTQPRVPLLHRVNEVLPGWLRVRGEFRERVEGFENSNFVEGRDDAYALSRFRFNVALRANTHLAFEANLQDARVAGKEVGPTTAPFSGPFDLRTAFADVGDAQTRIAFRLGRQELVYGESRLLGSLPWVNTGRSWDAAKLSVRAAVFQVDLFGASLVRSLPDEFDKSGNGNRLAGAYATSTKVLPKATVEPYVFWRRGLASDTDGLYSASGALLVPGVVGGATHTHVGQEIDLQVTRSIMAQLHVGAGYAFIISGGFLKEATPGASYSYPYVTATYVFLGS